MKGMRNILGNYKQGQTSKIAKDQYNLQINDMMQTSEKKLKVKGIKMIYKILT